MSRAEALSKALATLSVLEAYVEIPEVLDTEELQKARDDLATLLREEHDRWAGNPNGVPSDDWYRENVPTRDGELECDDGAIVSAGTDAGAYVQTWSWVAAPTCSIHPDELLAGYEEPCGLCAHESREEGW